VLLPTLRRSLLALLKTVPQTYGWCRTRWRGATLALTRQAKRGLTVAAETMRRWLHEVGWVWKRATRAATDDDPLRIARFARIRFVCEPLQAGEAMICADELDIPLWPKVGAAWMPKGTPRAVMTPGTKATYDLAGALDVATGVLLHCCGPRNTNALFRDLLQVIEEHYSTEPYTRLYVVVDNRVHPD
jgi:winged helix-turn-helix protein/DDE superfamily endonuclease